MLKMLRWVVALSVSTPFLVFHELISAAPRSTIFYCYAETPTGEAVDLTGMCQSGRSIVPVSSPQTVRNKPIANQETSIKKQIQIKPQLREKWGFSDLNYEGRVFVGTIRNRTQKPVSGVSVKWAVYRKETDTRWKMVDSGSVNTVDSRVGAGQKTTFKDITTLDGDRIVITNIE